MWKFISFFLIPRAFIPSFLLSFALSTPALALAEKRHQLLSIQGSNTIGANLAPALIQGFLNRQGGSQIEVIDSDVNESQIWAKLPEQGSAGSLGKIKVDIAAHGSGTGFKALRSLEADIAAASRPAKEKEVDSLSHLTQLTSATSEHIIGIDGLAIIIHPLNPIEQLSVQQVADIFSGKITNWSELGGRFGNINLYSRDNKSGTWDSFKRMVLGKAQLAQRASRYEANDELSDKVSSDVNAIGFVGLPSVRQSKLIAISDGFAKALKPTQLSIATEDYALSRRLYFYTAGKSNNPYVQSFIQFVLSPEGQEIVASNGFIAQHIEMVEPEGYTDLPVDFQQLTEQGQRLTVNFRFNQGSARLDNRALRDIQRLVEFSQNHPNKKLVLIGFGDQKKSHERSRLLSKLRAMAVRRELVKFGIYPKFSHGYGEQLPIASNLRESGRFKNRRVEVWLTNLD